MMQLQILDEIYNIKSGDKYQINDSEIIIHMVGNYSGPNILSIQCNLRFRILEEINKCIYNFYRRCLYWIEKQTKEITEINNFNIIDMNNKDSYPYYKISVDIDPMSYVVNFIVRTDDVLRHIIIFFIEQSSTKLLHINDINKI